MSLSSLCQLLLAKSREEDKQQHFYYSMFIFLVGFLMLPGVLSSVLGAFLVGLGKEIWDHYFGSGFCWYDMLANQLGIVFGWVIILPWVT